MWLVEDGKAIKHAKRSAFPRWGDGVGKSGVAMEWRRVFGRAGGGRRILALDALQVYRGRSIG